MRETWTWLVLHKAARLAEMPFYKDCVYRKHTMQTKGYTSWI